MPRKPVQLKGDWNARKVVLFSCTQCARTRHSEEHQSAAAIKDMELCGWREGVCPQCIDRNNRAKVMKAAKGY